MSRISDTIRQMTVSGVDFVNTYTVGRNAYPMINNGRYRCALMFTVEGDECYFCEKPQKNVFHTHPGTVLFLPQGSVYHISMDEPFSDVRVIDFSLACEVLPDPFITEVKNPHRFLSLFSNAEQQWNSHQPMSETVCRSILYEILSLVGAESEAYFPSQKRRKIEKAVAYLHDHYTEHDFKISELPKLAGLSHRYFDHLFFEEYRMSPKEYTASLRLARAKELLMAEKLSASDIAESLGYCDAFHFSKSFKQHTGISPTQFRRQNGVTEK